MLRLSSTLRRSVWLPCVIVLLLASRAFAGDGSLSADLDGDGVRDRITFDGDQPSLVHVWLSSTNLTHVIRSGEPLLHIVATDLDGDHRAELIAAGRTGVQVWTSGHHRFHTYHPNRLISPGAISRSSRRVADQGPGAAPSESFGFSPGPQPLIQSGYPRGPTEIASERFSRNAPGAVPFLEFAPLAPRPPPASLL